MSTFIPRKPMRGLIPRRKKRNAKAVPKATKKYVKHAIKVHNELKQLGILDEDAVDNEIGTQGTWEPYGNNVAISLVSIGQGDNDFSRDADKVELSHIDVIIKTNFPSLNPLIANYTETLSSRVIRYLFVQLKKQATVTQVLAVLNTTLVAGEYTPLMNNNKMTKFCHVLKDIIIQEKPKKSTVTNTAGANISIPSETVYHRVKILPKIKRLEWLTASTTAVIPDVSGAIVMLVYARENDTGAGSALTDAQMAHYSYNAVTRFREL